MRNFILAAVLAYLGYAYYQGDLRLPWQSDSPVVSNDKGVITLEPRSRPAPAPALTRQTQTPAYRCDGRTHCSQMRSYEEAVFFLRNCPGTQMDGDNDGIPCERQFGR